MRGAALYSGFLRAWDAVQPNHDKMLVGSIDRYFYSPERPSGRYKQFIQDHSVSMYKDILHDYDSNKNPITQLHGSLNQWGVNFISFYLAPTDYDYYIRVRPDIEISAPINFEDYDYPGNRVYVPEGNDHCSGVNDQMAFGSYAAMKKYFSIYTEHHKLFAKGLTFHTEFYVTENLKAQGVEIVRIPQTTQIIREWQAVKRENVIASEYPHEHWRMLQVKGREVLDLGAGRLWSDFPNTPEYFINEGATSVVGVEMSPSEEKWFGEHAPEITMYTDRIKDSNDLSRYFKMGSEVVKMDIEGAEEYLAQVMPRDMESIQEMAIEYHDNAKKRMIESLYSYWGFSHMEHYILHDFPAEEQGVIYLKR